MKYRSKLGTVINIPDGLTAKQIKQIKADADAGYGTRAQETANKLGKKLGKKEPAPSEPAPIVAPPAESSIDQGVVNPKTGTINAPEASQNVNQAEQEDIQTNFNLSQPRTITNQYGNKRTTVRDPVTGEVTVTDEAGGTAQKFKDLAEAAASTFNGDVSRQKAEEATYGTLTKYYDRDMDREREQAQQELANRGIPYNPDAAYDPNTSNLYGKTLGAINERYRGLKDDASRQAVLAGNQAYATDASTRDSFLNAVTSGANTFSGNFGQYQNTVQTDQSQDTKDLIALSSDTFLKKYGIDKDAYTKKLAINKPTGGGSSGGGTGGGGFELLD